MRSPVCSSSTDYSTHRFGQDEDRRRRGGEEEEMRRR